jgi:hypothetical protein
MKKFLLIVLVSLLVPTTGKATLPQGIQIKSQNIEYKAFSLEEYKQILVLEAKFNALKVDLDYARELAALDDQLIGALRDKIDSLKRTNVILVKDRDRLAVKWKDENRLRHLAENKVPWSTWAAWGVAGVATTAVAVLVVVLVVRD